MPTPKQTAAIATDAPTRRAVWQRIGAHPLFWALVCFAVALPWILTGSGDLFIPFILALIGGWLCAHTFVRFTFNMAKPWHGFLAHTLAAAIFGALMWWAISSGSDWPKQLPHPAREIVYFVQIAAAPGVTWLLISLLSRIMSIPRPRLSARKSATTRTAPMWEQNKNGTLVRFPAIRMKLSTLSWIIAGVVTVMGALVVVFLINFDWLMQFGSAQLIIIVVGLIFALPAYAALKFALGRRTVACQVLFGEDQVKFDAGNQTTVLKYASIQELTWRTNSDYAGIVAVPTKGTKRHISLITGMAKVPKNSLPELPPLAKRTMQRLAAAGLEQQVSKRSGMSIFKRQLPR